MEQGAKSVTVNTSTTENSNFSEICISGSEGSNEHDTILSKNENLFDLVKYMYTWYVKWVDKTNHMVVMTCILSKLEIEMFWPTMSHSNLTSAARRQLNTGMDNYDDVMRMIVGVQNISKTLAQHVTLHSEGVFKKRGGGGGCAKQRCYFGCSIGSTIVFFTIMRKK